MIDGNAEDIVRTRGYPFEEHFVDTSDGFILGLHVCFRDFSFRRRIDDIAQ